MLNVGINNPSLITSWVNDYRIAGPEALREKTRGQIANMTKPKIKSNINIDNTNEQADYLNRIEEENLKLRIEIAYLKESRRLRLEQEALNKKREFYVASEENSN